MGTVVGEGPCFGARALLWHSLPRAEAHSEVLWEMAPWCSETGLLALHCPGGSPGGPAAWSIRHGPVPGTPSTGVGARGAMKCRDSEPPGTWPLSGAPPHTGSRTSAALWPRILSLRHQLPLLK